MEIIQVKKLTYNTKYFVIAGLIGLMSGPVTAAVPHSFAAGDTIKSSEMNDNFTALDNDITNISLTPGPQGDQGIQGPIGATGATGPAGADGQDFSPVGASVGDIMYWDGSVWQLTPVSPACSGDHAVLKLISGAPTWVCPGVNYAIGDTGPAGGIVFYTTDDGLHGLEAAPANQSTQSAWGCQGVSIAGAADTAIGTGAANTAAIVAGCAVAGTAAKVADAYSLNNYNDWFLPSKDELNQLYRKKHVVGGFDNNLYWSSSQSSSLLAWFQLFTNGFQDPIEKDLPYYRVRAIRSF